MKEIKFGIIFFDFDGVIKESVEIKSDAFERLFLPFGDAIVKKVRKHHEKNCGMSRLDKLPIYLRWSGQNSSKQLIEQYSDQFSLLVKERVVHSDWVDGVLDYLLSNHHRQRFFLVTATPQKEIEEILKQLKIIDYFEQIVGSPISKSQALQKLLKQHVIDPKQAVMIGDSIHDYEAATDSKTNFILRKTNLNKKLQVQLNCPMIGDFL